MNMRSLIPWNRNNTAVPASYSDEERDPFLSLHREVNRLFDDVFRGFDLTSGFTGYVGTSGNWPRLEVADGDATVTVIAEVPGLAENDIELLLQNGTLILRGEKKSRSESKDRHFSEHFYGRFERRLDLGVDIDEDKVQAAFANGVLTVTLPKTERAQRKVHKILVKAQ